MLEYWNAGILEYWNAGIRTNLGIANLGIKKEEELATDTRGLTRTFCSVDLTE
jgi:hypothetical protein